MTQRKHNVLTCCRRRPRGLAFAWQCLGALLVLSGLWVLTAIVGGKTLAGLAAAATAAVLFVAA